MQLGVLLAWIYWWCNKPFVAVFTEALFGFGEGDLKVDGRAVVRKMDRLLHRINPPVFVQLVGTIALLPLYGPRSFPKSSLLRALVKFWFGLKSFFGHWHFYFSSRKKRAKWIDKMYRRLIETAPEQEEDLVKTIVTLTLLKSVLGIAYLEEEKVWQGLGYKPFHEREGITPPSGPNLAHPPRTPSAIILHENVKTPAQVAHKPPGKRTYCVIGSGAGGGVAARTLQERDPDARVILLELGSLVTNDQFTTHFMDSMATVFMNAAATLSQDMQFQFQQGRCVGGSTVVNNSVAFKPVGFWWENLKQRWQALGVNLDYDDLYRQYDVLEKLLDVAPVDLRITNKGGFTTRAGFEKLGLKPPPIVVNSNALDCIGCGRCNIGCQYDAKRSLMVTLIPDFVKAGGLLVPDAKVTKLEFHPDGDASNPYHITAVEVEGTDGPIRIEADRFILSAGAYASTKLLWRSGFLGAIPGVRTVGKRFSVNAGAPVVGIFPERLDSFNGQQIGFALEVPEERMIIETAFVPPGIISLGVPAWGPEFQRRIGLVNNMAVGVPVFATLAYGEIKRALLGDSGFAIDFSLIDEDWRRLETGMKITARAMFAMGAQEVFINRFNARSIRRVEDVDEYLAGIGPSDFITVQSAHMQGGNVIAPQPYYGVVDENLKVHGIKNLWICDASVIPSPITINIALTVMALSRYAALRIPDAP